MSEHRITIDKTVDVLFVPKLGNLHMIVAWQGKDNKEYRCGVELTETALLALYVEFGKTLGRLP